MAMSVVSRDHDLRRLLDVVAAAGRDPVPPGLPDEALARLAALISCDQVSLFELDSGHQTTAFMQNLVPEEDAADDEAIFWAHYESCHACCYPDRGDDRAVTTFSDFYGRRERQRIGMYSEYFRPYGIEESLMLVLPIAPRRSLRLEFFRGPGPDFTDRERGLLELFRPHLREICLPQRAFETPQPVLTQRQLELLRLVAEGRTNSQIARRLDISEGTVRKHLENIYQRLDVTSRTAAVLRAFPPQRIA